MGSGRVVLRLSVVALAASALTLAFARSIDPIQNPSGSGEVDVTTTTSAPSCEPKTIATNSVVNSDASRFSLAISQMAFDCAEVVVIASGDSGTLMVGAQLAAAVGGPLLIRASEDTEAISEEMVRLNASVVYIVGDSLPELPADTESRSLSNEEAPRRDLSSSRGRPHTPGPRASQPGKGHCRHRDRNSRRDG